MIRPPKAIIKIGLIKFHGTTKISVLNYMELSLKGFFPQNRTDQYTIMCSLVAHDRLQNDYKDDESSICDIAIPSDATIQ